jgi:hypothetical protein
MSLVGIFGFFEWVDGGYFGGFIVWGDILWCFIGFYANL